LCMQSKCSTPDFHLQPHLSLIKSYHKGGVQLKYAQLKDV
jgi:hypothetical protein